MATMSFGEHIEELRVRLILALVGLLVGVIVAFIPYLDLGWRVMKTMEAPAKKALETFYRNEYDKKAKAAEDAKDELSPTVEAVIPAESFVKALPEDRSHCWSCPRPTSSRARPSVFRSSTGSPP